MLKKRLDLHLDTCLFVTFHYYWWVLEQRYAWI